MRKVVSVYVDPDSYEEMKRVCHEVLDTSVSAKLDELIKKWVEEVTGKEFRENPVEYEGLKQKHLKLTRERERLEKDFRRKKVLDDLAQLTASLGIEDDLNNLEDVTPNLMREWTSRGHRKEDVHTWISFLELVRQKKQLEKQLEQIRFGLLPEKSKETGVLLGEDSLTGENAMTRNTRLRRNRSAAKA